MYIEEVNQRERRLFRRLVEEVEVHVGFFFFLRLLGSGGFASVTASGTTSGTTGSGGTTTSTDVGDEVHHRLLFQELGEETDPVRFNLDASRRDDSGELVGGDFLAVVGEDEGSVRAREISRHFLCERKKVMQCQSPEFIHLNITSPKTRGLLLSR
jgi:hypothetical protein